MKENQNPKIALNILLCSVLNIISLLHKGCFPRPCHIIISYECPYLHPHTIMHF